MTQDKQPVTIKKYANRRLYNTGSSTYVTLEDLAQMVKKGEDFVVFDAKTGEDITHSVLTQIIFEQEGKDGQNLLPITFLRQLIRFYGDNMQMLVPRYLEFSIDKLAAQQQQFREQMTKGFAGSGMPGANLFNALEEQARKNIAMFTQAMSVFSPYTPGAEGAAGAQANRQADKSPDKDDARAPADAAAAAPDSGEIDTLRRQLEEMQRKLDGLSRK